MNSVDRIPALRRLWQEAFGDDEGFLDKFFTFGFSPDRCRFISDGEHVAAALYWFDVSCRGQKMAYIYGVATGISYRNRGLCRRLMEDTRRHLTEQGYAGILLVPQNPGVIRMYEKMGYAPCTKVSQFRATAQAPAAVLQKLSPEEYARRRRALLPEDGVVQEGENLAFLSSYASFWGGENFLAAIATEGEKLQCPELLGDVSQAPHILEALNCREGFFRVPGQNQNFSMLFAIKDTCPKPGYFGHAFD